jgi:hypothetical protein
MCTADGAPDGASFPDGAGDGFASVAEALRAGDAVVDYLNSPAAGQLEGSGCGEALITIGRIQSRLAAAQATLLARFDAASAHDGDGYATAAAWLAGKTQLSRKDAKATVRQMRLLGKHPLLDAAAAGAELDDLRVIAQAAYEAWRGQPSRPRRGPRQGVHRPVPAARCHPGGSPASGGQSS